MFARRTRIFCTHDQEKNECVPFRPAIPSTSTGAPENEGTTYATGSHAPGSVIASADTWLGQLGNDSTDLDCFTTYRSDSRQDLIGYHGEHAPGPATLTMMLAGVGMVTLVACRRARD